MSESLTLVEWLARYDRAARPAVCPAGDPHAHDIDGKLINAAVRCVHGYSTNLEMPPLDVEQLRAALDELERLRAEHTALGRAEHQWRIVTPNGPTYSFTQRDLDDHANWLPGVRLEQRTVYGTPWEPADPQQAEAVEIEDGAR